MDIILESGNYFNMDSELCFIFVVYCERML